MGLSEQQLEAHRMGAQITFVHVMRAVQESRREGVNKPAYLVLTRYGQSLIHGEEEAKSVSKCLVESLQTDAVVVALIQFEGFES